MDLQGRRHGRCQRLDCGRLEDGHYRHLVRLASAGGGEGRRQPRVNTFLEGNSPPEFPLYFSALCMGERIIGLRDRGSMHGALSLDNGPNSTGDLETLEPIDIRPRSFLAIGYPTITKK